MKNLIIGLFAALLMSAGLVGVAETGASAAPYPPSVDTTTRVSGPGRVLQGQRATFCVTVKSVGSGSPRGTVTMTVSKHNGAFSYTASKAYRGQQVCFTTPRLTKVGDYTARAHFEGDGVFKNSNDSKGFSVVKA